MLRVFSILIFLLIAVKSFAAASTEKDSFFDEVKNESEVSYVSQSGNSDQKTFSGASKTILGIGRNKLTLDGNYTYGEAEEIRNAENWIAGLRYGYQIKETLKLFVGELVEANRFAGIDRRYNTDAGAQVRLYKSDNAVAKFEGGYRYTVEKRTTFEERKDSKGRFVITGERKITPTLKGKTNFEYLPNFTESEDYQMNWDSSLSFFISDALSLKMSYLWQFDNQPTEGKTQYDRITKTALVATF